VTLILAGVYARQSVVTPLDGYRLHRAQKGVGSDRKSRTGAAQAYVPSRYRLGSVLRPESFPESEILSGDQHRLSRPQASRGNQTAAECNTRDSGHHSLCPKHGKPDRRDFLPEVAGRGPGPRHDRDSFSHKTQKIRIVPVNAEVRRILEFWKLGRKNEYVFYNRKTGERFVDPDAGLELACKKAEIEGVTPCYQLAAGSKVQLYYGYENCRFHSRRRLQGGRAPGSQNQKIPQSPF